MNTVVNFKLPDPPESMLVQKIRRVSKPMGYIATAIAGLIGILLLGGLVALFLYEGPLLRIDEAAVYIFFAAEELANAPQTVAISELSLSTRIGLFVIGFLQYAPLLLVFSALRRLFNSLAKQPIFTPEQARTVKLVGGWLIVFAVIPFFTDFIAEAVGSPDRNWFKYSSIGAVFLGGLLVLLGQVMQHGSALERENASIL